MSNLIDIILDIDKALIKFVPNIQSEYLDPLMIWFTKLWDLWALWIWSALCMIFIFNEFKREWIIQLIWLLINLIFWEWILKHLFMRNRPFIDIPDIILKIPAPITSSFPSWHTSASICFASIFTYYFVNKSKLATYIVWFLAIWISFSRFYLQAHYPSDILAWAILWLISANLAIYIHEKWLIKKCLWLNIF